MGAEVEVEAAVEAAEGRRRRRRRRRRWWWWWRRWWRWRWSGEVELRHEGVAAAVKVVSKAPAVVGKSDEIVYPVT